MSQALLIGNGVSKARKILRAFFQGLEKFVVKSSNAWKNRRFRFQSPSVPMKVRHFVDRNIEGGKRLADADGNRNDRGGCA